MSIKEVVEKLNKEVTRLEDEEDEVVSTHDTIDFLKHISKDLKSLTPEEIVNKGLAKALLSPKQTELEIYEEFDSVREHIQDQVANEDEEEDIFDSKTGEFKVKWTNGKEEVIQGKDIKEALAKVGKKIADIESWDDV